jgi:hypothetical protein
MLADQPPLGDISADTDFNYLFIRETLDGLFSPLTLRALEVRRGVPSSAALRAHLGLGDLPPALPPSE